MPSSDNSMRDSGIITVACRMLKTAERGLLARPNPNVTSQQASNNSLTIPTQGWTSSPSGRGSIEILWSCLITICLCSWSVLCLQVPGQNDSRLTLFWRRLWLTALCGLGPEFNFQIALGQLISARKSVRDFHLCDYPDWTIKHAFYADSGGFLLHTPDFKTIPIDAKQLLYLINRKYVEYPKISLEEIENKNKAEDLLRLISIGQIVWFTATMIARGAQGLAITGLSSQHLRSFSVALAQHIVGGTKEPIATAITLETGSTMVSILKDAENAPKEMYEQSPLDFVTQEEWHWSRYWKHWINILRNMRIVFAPQKLPFDRLENADWRELKRGGQIVFFLITIAYSALFITAWNSHFPTDSKRVVWRIASLSMTATIPLYFIITAFAYEVFLALVQYFNPAEVSVAELQAQKISPQPLPRCELDDNLDKGTATQSIFKRESGASAGDHISSQPLSMEICSEEQMPSQALSKKELRICSKEPVSILPEKCSRLSRIAASLRNNSTSKNPSLYIPLKATIPMYAIAFLYCSSRTVILILDLIQLRSLPQSAFNTVNWGSFVPHISWIFAFTWSSFVKNLISWGSFGHV
ncbi:hypothetical protein OCU04_013156 [Sclerotinia nivalis]|uniref:Uncharacterized protein n=1 Tax=Sclerotinia nivalis TaxID=352851 RepID=A0A9X0A9A0_9HELO|nr:hypothetical protein OCU04_013156 [Sclerotinia nivalis]